jgi:hypothetical protein
MNRGKIAIVTISSLISSASLAIDQNKESYRQGQPTNAESSDVDKKSGKDFKFDIMNVLEAIEKACCEHTPPCTITS